MAEYAGEFTKVPYIEIRSIRRTLIGLGIAVLFVGGVGGCASLPPLSADGADFVVGGRLAVRDDKQSFSASFSWMQNESDYAIELWGPFGAGRVRLRGNDSEVTITEARGELVRGVDPVVLMERELGWSLPVGALSSWIQGEPAPRYAYKNLRRADSRIESFEQNGWLIELDRYGAIDGVERPARVVATSARSRIVVVVRSWHENDV